MPQLSNWPFARQFEVMLSAKQQWYGTDPRQSARRLCGHDLDILRDRSAWVPRVDESHAHASSASGHTSSSDVEWIPIAVGCKIGQNRPDLIARKWQNGSGNDLSHRYARESCGSGADPIVANGSVRPICAISGMSGFDAKPTQRSKGVR